MLEQMGYVCSNELNPYKIEKGHFKHQLIVKFWYSLLLTIYQQIISSEICS
jgi:hypothetical protein